MSFCCRIAFLFLLSVAASAAIAPQRVWAEQTGAQYLLFHIFIGKAEPQTGIYQRGVPDDEILRIARAVAASVRPKEGNPDRILGFAVGPIVMDQGAAGARAIIRGAFDIALATDMAVAIHLDDYMFWKGARWPDGRLLVKQPGTTEWADWSGAPAAGLDISWLPGVKLPPQMCYESPTVKQFVGYWTKEVIGPEIEQQLRRLAAAGKSQLFAGVIAGWESNLSEGYCSLTHLGYSKENPPADFDHERERILQRHIELWAKGLFDAGIPKNRIFTHVAPMPRGDYAKLAAAMPLARIRAMPQSTAFRAYWVAFNNYSDPGFSAYVDPDRFTDIYAALRAHNAPNWAMAEGSNVVLGPLYPDGVGSSPLSWETYLAKSFNHGAEMVNIFAAFQGPPQSPFRQAGASADALAAYRKFLRGDRLTEDTSP
jgi:hypothetical protein